jgi:hypothetical protein
MRGPHAVEGGERGGAAGVTALQSAGALRLTSWVEPSGEVRPVSFDDDALFGSKVGGQKGSFGQYYKAAFRHGSGAPLGAKEVAWTSHAGAAALTREVRIAITPAAPARPLAPHSLPVFPQEVADPAGVAAERLPAVPLHAGLVRESAQLESGLRAPIHGACRARRPAERD